MLALTKTLSFNSKNVYKMCINLYVTYIFKTSVYFYIKDSFHITKRSLWIYIALIATVCT